MIIKGALFVSRDPHDARWGLGSLATSTRRLLLIGWRYDSPTHDAGVPELVSGVVARALTAVARVTFPTSMPVGRTTEIWSTTKDTGLVRNLGSGGWGKRLMATLNHAPAELVLLSTQSPDEVVGMFDDPAYPWWLQGQLALLSPLNLSPPDIDRETMVSLIDDEWAEHAASISDQSLLALLRPGVDGDVAGVLVLKESFTGVLLKALEHESQRVGLGWEVVSEEELTDRLAGD